MNTTKKIQLASYIEHTLLKPEATQLQIETLCQEAITHSFKGICVNSYYVSLAQSKLKNHSIILVSVIGFPLGANISSAKAAEARLAEEHGAQEIDMVINIGAAKDHQWNIVEKDISTVTKATTIPVKVILETGLLNHEEIINTCMASEAAGAKFVKTCTGFAPGSATVEHVKLMRQSVSAAIQVKASGGIKSYAQAVTLIEAGATRLGTSSGVQLINEQTVSPNSY